MEKRLFAFNQGEKQSVFYDQVRFQHQKAPAKSPVSPCKRGGEIGVVVPCLAMTSELPRLHQEN
jgi:hypothetical protein